MNSWWAVTRWLNGEPRHRLGLALFQRAIGLSLLFRVITELPFAAFLWGPHSIASEGSIGSVFGANAGGWGDALFRSEAGTYGVLVALAAGAAGLLFQRLTRISALLACVAFNVLGARLPELQDGGDNLATLALMYMVLLLPAGANANAGSIRSWLHNLGASAVIVQVCIVYFVAGFMKMYGDSWHNGTALYLISQVEWFSSPATRSWFANPIVATSGAYSTMLFQVWFPIALFSRLKFAFLAVAMMFHLGIAVSMGLLTFSLIMAGADLSLVTDAEYRRIIRRVGRRWRELRDRRLAIDGRFGDRWVQRW